MSDTDRIEEIKEHIKYFRWVDVDDMTKGLFSDIEYLLSRLEDAEAEIESLRLYNSGLKNHMTRDKKLLADHVGELQSKVAELEAEVRLEFNAKMELYEEKKVLQSKLTEAERNLSTVTKQLFHAMNESKKEDKQ